MIQADVRRPAQLDPAELELWRRFCAADEVFHNPLLGPDFAQLVGEVRSDTWVAVLRRGGQVVGFLPFHKRASGLALPVGSSFSDYHALVCAPGEHVDGAEALAAAGLGGLRMTAMVDPHGSFPGSRPSPLEGFVITFDGDPVAHDLDWKTRHPKRYRNWRRLEKKLQQQCGELVFTIGSTSQADLDLLVRWKRDQFHRTGLHDVLRPEWSRALYRKALERRTGELQGLLTTLHAGGKLVAGHFGVTANGVFHTWLSSMNPDHAPCGPGTVLMLHLPEVMAERGLRSYDLGPGYAHYKGPFASRTVTITEGVALSPGRASLAARSLDSAWALAGDQKVEAVSRLRRRLGHITAAEVSFGGCVRGLVEAVAAMGRRSASREHEQAQAAGQDA